MKNILLLNLALVLFISVSAPAETRLVPDDYTTIQAAIDASTDGDTVIVAPGIYCENIDFLGKNILLTSTQPYYPTIVSSTIISGEGDKVSGRHATVLASDGTIMGFNIFGNYGVSYGKEGVAYSPTIAYCSIVATSYSPGEVGCSVFGSIPYGQTAIPIIENSLLYGGIYLNSSSGGANAIIRNNVIISYEPGSGFAIFYRDNRSIPTVTGNIIMGFEYGINMTYNLWEQEKRARITYNNFWDNTTNYIAQGVVYDITSLQGNVSTDPLFVDPARNDYHLLPHSPCIDAGDPFYIPDSEKVDMDGEDRISAGLVDIGPDEVSDKTRIPIGLTILGPNEMPGQSTAQYLAVVTYNDGFKKDVTFLAAWSTFPDDFARVDAEGLLQTRTVEIHTSVTLRAHYSEASVLTEAETLVDLFPPQHLHVPAQYPTIQAAVDVARSGDTVMLADGIYTGPGNRDIYFGGKNITVCSENGPEKCIIDCQGTEAEYHRGFNLRRGENAGSAVIGLTITNGYADDKGGGIYCTSSGLNVVDCNIINNRAGIRGGGIYCADETNLTNSFVLFNSVYSDQDYVQGGGIYCIGHLKISGSHLEHNCVNSSTGRAQGGGVYCGGVLIIISSTINANSVNCAEYGGGGGTYSMGCLNIEDCTISGNSAAYGGGVYCRDDADIILSSIISGNRAERLGGGIWCYGATISNCTITDNEAERGGGIVSGGSFMIDHCRISLNSARMWGGGLDNLGDVTYPTLVNCTFSENSATEGGAVYNESNSNLMLNNCILAGNSAEEGGGICHVYRNNLMLNNCTFTGNSAAIGKASILNYLWRKNPSNIRLVGCILWDDEIEISNKDGSRITISYSDVQYGQVGIYDPWGELVWGPGNIDVDPCFADPNNGDYHLKSQAGRWDPKSLNWVKDEVTSPCIDASDPMSLIGYEPFPNGGVVNMGAYGGTAEASKSYFGEPVCQTIVAGDINGDCKVDFEDFAIIALHWMEDKRF